MHGEIYQRLLGQWSGSHGDASHQALLVSGIVEPVSDTVHRSVISVALRQFTIFIEEALHVYGQS
jgi:hypothetical protein